jgi:hypothetical protein
VLIQLLLPAGGAPSADGRASRRNAEGVGGTIQRLTAYLRSPAKGLWTAPDGDTEQDDVVMVEVVTETFDRAWWRAYAITLAKRFRQESIHVRAVAVDILDEGH